MLFESYMLYLTERDYGESYPVNTDITKIRISSVPYCNRKSYYAKMGLANKASNYLQRAAHEGRVHHTTAQIAAEDYAKSISTIKVGIEESIEIPLDVDNIPVYIRGKMDLVWYLPEDEIEIVDIKATASKGWYNTRNYGAYPSHVDQVLMYCWGYRRIHKPTKAPTGALWYKNRNDGMWHEFVIPYDVYRIEFLVGKIEDLVRALREEIPPDNHSPMHSFECSSKSGRCPFHNLCYDDEGNFKKHRKEEED